MRLSETRGLEDLDQSIIKELEETVRRSQAMDMPYIRQPGIPFESTTKSPDDEDLEFSCSLYTMSHEDQPVISNYAETLVTIMPSPVRSAEKSGDSEDGMIFSMDEDDVISPKESKTEEEKPAMTDLHEYGNTKPSTSPAGTSRQGWAIPLTAAGSAEYVVRRVRGQVALRLNMLCHRSKPSLRDILGEQLATPPGSSGQSGKVSKSGYGLSYRSQELFIASSFQPLSIYRKSSRKKSVESCINRSWRLPLQQHPRLQNLCGVK